MITRKGNDMSNEIIQEAMSFDTVSKRPKMAICYDFDRTLSPDDMQTFTLIPSFGVDKSEFWHESDTLATENLMDNNLAWMYELIKYSKFKGKSLRKEYFNEIGSDVQLYEGVDTWFENINAYADEQGIDVEHYIISSGLKEIIEGSRIAPYITRVYASSYLYSADGIAEWPAQVVNYTTKTQFIFRIAKGYLEEYDPRVNDSLPHSMRNVDYENIVYIGDSATDIPCMTLVKQKGGYSIGVYDPESGNKKKVYKLFGDGRLNFYAPARYTPDSPIFSYMKDVIDEISAREKQKCEQKPLHEASEGYKRRSAIKEILDTPSSDISPEEREVLLRVIQKIK
ncbi:MAG: haloacid dehalogenase-like hydrolase [Clostridia bacterium]|nr:haloacid dehalogenase-like hydrolase [Clostridia bacterium]